MPIKSIAEATDEEWTACQRLADAVNLHVLAQNAQLGNGRDRPGYVAVRLADGHSDGTLYDTRADAVRHTRDRDPHYAYIKVGRDTMTPREAWVVLMYQRQAAATGHVLAEEEVVLPHRLELIAGHMPRTAAGAVPHMFRGPGYRHG